MIDTPSPLSILRNTPTNCLLTRYMALDGKLQVQEMIAERVSIMVSSPLVGAEVLTLMSPESVARHVATGENPGYVRTFVSRRRFRTCPRAPSPLRVDDPLSSHLSTCLVYRTRRHPPCPLTGQSRLLYRIATKHSRYGRDLGEDGPGQLLSQWSSSISFSAALIPAHTSNRSHRPSASIATPFLSHPPEHIPTV